MILFRSIIALIILIIPLHAQVQTYIYFNEAFESNPFLLPDAQESWVSTIEVGVQLNISPISISYNGSYTNFSNFEERTFYWHQAALFSSFGKSNIGVFLNQRFNRNDYTVYNYNTLTGYINHSRNIDTFNFYLGGNVVYNTYPELSQIDNLEVNGSLRINKSFETRTTFIIGSTLHYKKYTTSYSYIDTLFMPSGSGSGQGTNTGMHSLLQSIEVPAPSVSQLQYWIRIAQSLTNSTGVAAQFRSGILPAQLIMKASTYLGEKKYTAQGIYIDQETFDPQTLRSDKYHTAHMRLRKNLSIHSTRLAIEFWYRWSENSSNSYWYNFDNHYGSVSINLNF